MMRALAVVAFSLTLLLLAWSVIGTVVAFNTDGRCRRAGFHHSLVSWAYERFCVRPYQLPPGVVVPLARAEAGR